MSKTPEAVSLLGKPLYADAVAEGDALAKLEHNLQQAEAEYRAEPDNVEKLIWYGRNLGWLWRFCEAIAVYTAGIERFPEEAMLYRHRGHRYISTRQFAEAAADLEQAARLKDDSFDIWYHLGLARWLLGDFEAARAAYEECYRVTEGDELLVAITDWLYLTLRRLGRDEEAEKLLAPIHPQMDIKENVHYYMRLLMYKGLKTEAELQEARRLGALENVTIGYGVGCWHLVNGRTDQAFRYFQEIVEQPMWAAFGYIAAEAELARHKGA